MAAEPTTRFAHLLQPIRDLSKVWKIEIAEELERYIEEVSQLLVTDPEDGITQLNFAEAALLIQGSTAIYSRKVELLYQLVYQALDLLALDKSGKDAANKRGKAVQSGFWAPIPETEELLTIDHLIKEGRNILLDHTAPERRQAEQRRVPLFLMPRDPADPRRTEFRISSCTVHHTGAYLLQASDARLLDDIMSTQEPTQGEHFEEPLVPAPPREVQDLDDRLQELLRDLPEDAPGGADFSAGTPGIGEETQLAKHTPATQRTPLAQRSLALASAEAKPGGALAPAPDPWTLIDEHETVGQDTPLEVGKTSKRLNKKKLLMNAEGLPQTGAVEGLTDDASWVGDYATGAAPLLTAGDPVESLFLAVAGRLRAGGRYETQRAGFSAAWLEFEDLFAAAASKRRQLKSNLKRPSGAPRTPHASDDEASDVEVPPAAEFGTTPQRLITPVQDPSTSGAHAALQDTNDERLRQQEQRREVAMLETMIEDAQGKYESTIRQHLQAVRKDGDGDDRRFPQLFANVKRWQEQLEPVLKEFESRPEFNIHDYSKKFLAKMTNIQQGGVDENKAIPFSRLVYGQPRWEVCRRFLTCLILTNHGNTDIIYETEAERLNGFRIKLLKAEAKMISLDGEDEAAPAPLPHAAPGRGAKRAKAVQEGTAGGNSGNALRKRQKSG